MILDKQSDPYGRQMDDFLMRRLDRMEAVVDEMRMKFSDIAVKLDKIAETQELNQPSISAMKSVLDAGGMMKWAVSTVVVVCAGFAAVMTAWEAVQKLEAVQKWLGK